MNWLFKEEPSHYNFAALVADTWAVWSGVRNPVAQKHLHEVKRGDRIFYYHTGDEKAIVGMATAIGNAYPDPDSETGSHAVVDITPVGALARPVTLAEIKADGRFTEFPLVRISRLSVMPVSDEEWDRIEALSKTAAAPAKKAAAARRSARR